MRQLHTLLKTKAIQRRLRVRQQIRRSKPVSLIYQLLRPVLCMTQVPLLRNYSWNPPWGFSSCISCTSHCLSNARLSCPSFWRYFFLLTVSLMLGFRKSNLVLTCLFKNTSAKYISRWLACWELCDTIAKMWETLSSMLKSSLASFLKASFERRDISQPAHLWLSASGTRCVGDSISPHKLLELARHKSCCIVYGDLFWISI